MIICNQIKAANNISLEEYLERKNIEKSTEQIYLLNRCSAIYSYASAVTLNSDEMSSKKFIQIANNLLFKSVELRVIENKETLEIAKEKVEKKRKELFKNYTEEGKKNWDKNKSYFKGSYIAKDILICDKLVNGK